MLNIVRQLPAELSKPDALGFARPKVHDHREWYRKLPYNARRYALQEHRKLASAP
jgi:hypothetical protein